jgi:RHS repeat-associated protein
MTAISHDHNGNLTGDGQYTHAYDEHNRLIRVTRILDSAVVGEYVYDALGRRVAKLADGDGDGNREETRFYFDGARAIEDQTAGGVTLATYVLGRYVDEVLTMDRSGSRYFYHQNTLWSPHAVSDGAGNVVERYAYDAYGKVTVTDGLYVAVPLTSWGTPHSGIGNRVLFTGRELDEETGLYFYRARYHDAAKGRFLQRDPLGYVDGLNLYCYVRNRPTKFLDPTGKVMTAQSCKDYVQFRKSLYSVSNKCSADATSTYLEEVLEDSDGGWSCAIEKLFSHTGANGQVFCKFTLLWCDSPPYKKIVRTCSYQIDICCWCPDPNEDSEVNFVCNTVEAGSPFEVDWVDGSNCTWQQTSYTLPCNTDTTGWCNPVAQ